MRTISSARFFFRARLFFSRATFLSARCLCRAQLFFARSVLSHANVFLTKGGVIGRGPVARLGRGPAECSDGAIHRAWIVGAGGRLHKITIPSSILAESLHNCHHHLHKIHISYSILAESLHKYHRILVWMMVCDGLGPNDCLDDPKP